MGEFSLLAVLAHPDDEAVLIGGTLAKYAHEGVAVYLISATRGESTKVEDDLISPQVLGDICEQELRAAAAILGVKQVRFLGGDGDQLPIGDSADLQEKIVRAIRELKPQVVITFGPEGIYGHPDHVALHELTSAAFLFARDPDKYSDHIKEGLQTFTPQKLYYSVMPQGLYREMVRHASEQGDSFSFPIEVDENLIGTPDDLVTAVIDVNPFVETKLRAIECHRTEVEPGGPSMGDFSLTDAEHLLSKEYYVLGFSHLPPTEGIEDDLFAGLR